MTGRVSRQRHNGYPGSHRERRNSEPNRDSPDGMNLTLILFGSVFCLVSMFALLAAMRIVLGWF
jgi:hypothetical protein